MSEMLEKCVQAARMAKIADVCDITDYLGPLVPGDAIDLGVKLGTDSEGRPKFHSLSDVRCDELDDCHRAILRPIVLAVLDALMEPDMDMILAGESALEEFEDASYDSLNGYEYTYRMPGWERHVLRAMITAAKETK